MHPYVDHNRLIERVLAISEYRDAYRARLRKLIDGPFSPDTMRRRIERARRYVGQAGASANRAGKSNSPTTRPSPYERLRPPPLDWFVQRRAESIRAQLDGRRPGYIPAFRDPELVPDGWSPIVVPAAALLEALDADKDGRISELEATKSAADLCKTAAPMDAPAATAALEPHLTESMRKAAPAKQWAAWLIKIADTSKDSRIDTTELIAAYRRLLAAADFDYDNMMGGRELIEAMTGTGPP
jgi:hypothetical protein